MSIGPFLHDPGYCPIVRQRLAHKPKRDAAHDSAGRNPVRNHPLPMARTAAPMGDGNRRE